MGLFRIVWSATSFSPSQVWFHRTTFFGVEIVTHLDTGGIESHIYQLSSVSYPRALFQSQVFLTWYPSFRFRN